jgi:hypothetical protein
MRVNLSNRLSKIENKLAELQALITKEGLRQ